MQKTLYKLISVLLISYFFTLPSAFGNSTGSLKSQFNEKTGFYYTVQKGDTLWDLSQKFYSSEWDWPGLWELNDQIKNPHIIYPGERLRVFYKGELSLENRPVYVKPEKVKTAEKKEPVAKPAKGEVKKVEKLKTAKPEIKLSFVYPFINSVGFIKRNAVHPVGKILRAEKKADLITENDIVYIKASPGSSLEPGKKYHIYATKKIARHRVRHSLKGIIEITAMKKKYFTAKVIESYIDINPGDPIMNFIERDREFTVKKDNNRINGKIVCNDEDDSMFGERQLIYLSLGEKDNIEKGQIYTTYKELEKEGKTSFEPIKTGKIIVLHTEDVSSTALIFSTFEEIHIGDPVH